MKDTFKIVVPAEIHKGKDDTYFVRGIASTQNIDSQDEIVLQDGADFTPIAEGRGILNWDHQKGPENVVGLLDKYSKTKDGIYVEGRLFKNHQKAKSIQEIMSSLGKRDKGRMGMSIEGQILKRNSSNPKIVEKCRINAVALTLNPVNCDTYVELMKSMTVAEIEVSCKKSEPLKASEKTYTATQVVGLLEKALSVGSGGMEAPDTRSGGDALAREDFDFDIQKNDPINYEEGLNTLLNKLHILYPRVNKEILWEAVKDRLQTKFPSIGEHN